MKIRLDDITYTIEVWDNELQDWQAIKHNLKTNEWIMFVKKILSDSQFNDFIGNDTHRTFAISKKRAAALDQYINH